MEPELPKFGEPLAMENPLVRLTQSEVNNSFGKVLLLVDPTASPNPTYLPHRGCTISSEAELSCVANKTNKQQNKDTVGIQPSLCPQI